MVESDHRDDSVTLQTLEVEWPSRYVWADPCNLQIRPKKEKEGKKRKNENRHKPLTAHDPMAAGAVRLGNLKQATLET